MQRKAEKIEVAFGSKGSQELKRDLRSIGGAIGEMKTKAAGAVQTVATFGAGFGAAAAAWTAGMGAIALSNNDYIESISRLSNVTGTGLDEMSRLAGVARRYGVDIDDLRGSMIQFFGQAAAGAKGDAIAEEFEKIGISSKFLADNLDDPIKILLAVAKAQKQLTGANRTGVLSVLFGEDDSAKVGELLNALGSDSKAVVDAIKEIDASGAIVSQKDVDTTREYNAAMAEFSDVFLGLRLELGRGILPILSKLSGATAEFVRSNRAVITGALLGGWERVSYVIQDVIDYLEGGRAAVRGSWLYPVVGWMEGIGKAGGVASRIMGELFDELSGNRRTREFKWVDGLAAGLKTLGGLSAGAIDAAFAVVGGAAMGSLQLLNQLPAGIAIVQAAWSEFTQGFQGTVTGTGLAELGGLFGALVDYAVGFGEALASIASGKPVDAQFAWLKQLVDASPDLIRTLREMGDLGSIMRGVGENFDFIAAASGPVLVGLGGIFAAFGGLGVAFAIAGIALGLFITKLADAHDWINAPFRGLDAIIRELNGAAQADRDMLAEIKRNGDEWAEEMDRRSRSMGTDPVDLAALQQRFDTGEPLQIPAQIKLEDIEGLVAEAQLRTSGAVAMSQFPGQITAATTAADTAVRRAAQAVPTTEPRGIPIIIQLQPGGGETTVYAPTEDDAQKLLDMYANARRASATPGGLPFAGPRP